MELIRTGVYSKALKRLVKLGATTMDIEAIETAIAARPEGGDVISGTGDLRKVRFGYGRGGKAAGAGRSTMRCWARV